MSLLIPKDRNSLQRVHSIRTIKIEDEPEEEAEGELTEGELSATNEKGQVLIKQVCSFSSSFQTHSHSDLRV
jgi:hypothetical protein